MVGPDFQTPDATLNAGWSGTESRITSQPGDYAHWCDRAGRSYLHVI
jgi:hypothetical protein